MQLARKGRQVSRHRFISSPPRVKICCIASLAEARMAVEAGASALGLVSEMPSGPGVIDENLIAEIIRDVPPPIATFLLTSKVHAGDIISQLDRCKPSVVQLVDYVDINVYDRLRVERPHVKICQVVHVEDEASVEHAVKVSEHVDLILLDSGNTKSTIKALGGTGRTHDWNLSARVVESVDCPVFLAGGLTPTNVPSALTRVPNVFGLDLCSGVRTNHQLDKEKLASFFNALQRPLSHHN